MTARAFHVYEPPLVPRSGEVFWLAPQMKAQWQARENAHLLVKLAWHQIEPNEVASRGRQRRYRTGATIVVDREGRVRAVLRNADGELQSRRRGAFLARLFADDSALAKRIGPDGRPLSGAVRASRRGDTLSTGRSALHVAGDPPWR